MPGPASGGCVLGTGLRILSANLFWGRADPDEFAALLERLDIDVVAVQELGPAQADAIARVMDYGQLEPEAGANGMGIALRRPAEFDRIPMPLRAGRIVRLRPESWPELAAPTEVVNVHLAAPHSFADGVGLLQRGPQLRRLLDYLRATPAAARAVVGDFNATPLWPAYRRMVSQLTDAAVDASRTRGCGPELTWGRSPGSRRLLRIDHAFVEGLRTESFEVSPIVGSDHHAIVIECSPSAAAVPESAGG